MICADALSVSSGDGQGGVIQQSLAGRIKTSAFREVDSHMTRRKTVLHFNTMENSKCF